MNRTALQTAAFAFVAVLAACGPVDQAELGSAQSELKAAAPTARRTTAPSYGLLTTDAKSAAPSWKTSYSIASTYTVYFATEIANLSGHHTESVFVNLPGGQAYTRYDVSFATDVAAAAGEVQAEKTATGYRLWVAMPVAGTDIQNYNLSGPWTASVYLDTASVPAATAGFSMQ